jgi:hypothetical protein
LEAQRRALEEDRRSLEEDKLNIDAKIREAVNVETGKMVCEFLTNFCFPLSFPFASVPSLLFPPLFLPYNSRKERRKGRGWKR